MRVLLLFAVIASSNGVHAQGAEDPAGDDDLSLIVRVERALWAAADGAAGDFVLVFNTDTTEALPFLLQRIRKSGYEAGLQAARANLLAELLGALRAERGDAIPLCADEAQLRQHLGTLVIAGDDLVELDATRFEDMSFSASAYRDRMAALVAPMQGLIAEHQGNVVDVCVEAPAVNRRDDP